MSTCISREGEYSDHDLPTTGTATERFTCARCFALAEDDLLAALAAAEDRLRRVEALLKPYECHQCRGTGQQIRGESGGLRSVDAPLPTETCHLCRGTGTVKPIGVTNHDLRAALDSAPTDERPDA